MSINWAKYYIRLDNGAVIIPAKSTVYRPPQFAGCLLTGTTLTCQQVLAEARGALIPTTRLELAGLSYPHRAISDIRKILERNPDIPHYVINCPRRGYYLANFEIRPFAGADQEDFVLDLARTLAA